MKQLAFLLTAAAALAGCAAPAGIAMIGGEAAGAGASAGVERTMNGVTYRTYVQPLPEVESAVREALKTMSIDVTEEKDEPDYGRTLNAKTERRTVKIRLEKISDATTQLRVDARINLLSHDGATSGEVINQTTRILDERASTKLPSQ